MKLKEVYSYFAEILCLYEEAEDPNEYYDNLFIGNRNDIPNELLEREIGVIGVSSEKGMLDIELKKKKIASVPMPAEERKRRYAGRR